MTTDTPAVRAEPADSPRRLAVRTVRHLKAQVEDWCDECRLLVEWEDEHLVDNATPQRLEQHARLLEDLERVGRWLASATRNPDFPDRPTAALVATTLDDLADTRAMWHGKPLEVKQQADILKTCFNES